jgi:hypothetical protein
MPDATKQPNILVLRGDGIGIRNLPCTRLSPGRSQE